MLERLTRGLIVIAGASLLIAYAVTALLAIIFLH